MKDYNQVCDTWSVGCIMYELMNVVIARKETKTKEDLLEGISNATPFSHSDSNTGLSPRDSEDPYQLSGKDIIVRQLQKLELTDDDFQFVDGQDKLDLSFMNQGVHKIPLEFKKFRKHFGKDLVDLVESLLSYNPQARPTAKEAIKHKCFDEVRNKFVEAKKFEKHVHLQQNFYSHSVEGMITIGLQNHSEIIEPIIFEILKLL